MPNGALRKMQIKKRGKRAEICIVYRFNKKNLDVIRIQNSKQVMNHYSTIGRNFL